MKEKRQKELNELVKKAMQGDKHALTELCRVKGQSVVFLCTKALGNLQDGEDAAQEVFITLQKKITELQAHEAFNVWLQKLINYTCNNMRRKDMKKKSELPLEHYEETLYQDNLGFLPEEYVHQQEHRRELLTIINELPDGMRSCVYGFYYENLTAAELAQVLDTTEDTVYSQLYRARLRIRNGIQKKDPDAYKGKKLLSMSILTLVFKEEADALVPAATVASFLQGVGIAAGTTAFTVFGLSPRAWGITVPVVTAVAVVGIVAFNMASNPQPVSESIPQYSTQEPASGIEDIELSSVAPEQYPSVPVQQVGAIPLSGKVELVHADGRLLASQLPFSNMFHAHLKKDGVLMASTTISQDGSFVFNELEIAEKGTYTVHILLPSSRVAEFTSQNPDGVVSVVLSPGEPHVLSRPIYITDGIAPVVNITFSTEDGRHTSVNPHKAVIGLFDITTVHCSWHIENSATGQAVASGSALTLQDELWDLADGSYRLVVQATDAAGNSATYTGEFLVA